MTDPVSHLKRELLAAAERQQGTRFWLRKPPSVARAFPCRLGPASPACRRAGRGRARHGRTTAGWAIVREVVLDRASPPCLR